MWVVTKIGFFSAVQKHGTDYLTIRARVKKDLENLIPYLPGEGHKILELPGHDYPYRLLCWHESWAEAMAKLSQEVDYDNFKSEIGLKDPARESVLHRVWSALFGLEELERPPKTQGAEGYTYPKGNYSAWLPEYDSYQGVDFKDLWIGKDNKKGNKK
jgi:hypothetical protein